jgi:hypothetical protein
VGFLFCDKEIAPENLRQIFAAQQKQKGTEPRHKNGNTKAGHKKRETKSRNTKSGTQNEDSHDHLHEAPRHTPGN